MFSDQMSEKNISQQPAIELFKKMGYTYITKEEVAEQRKRTGKVGCLLQDILHSQMKKINQFEYNGKIYKFSNYNIDKAIADLNVPIEEGLIKASEKVHNMLILGKSYEELVEDRTLSFDINYVDWKNFENNVFHVTDEFEVDSYTGENNARVDIVLFVNGIPFCAIECKSGVESINQAVEQSIRNQTDSYIPQLFKYTSLVIAANKNDVLYGTTRTSKKFFSKWNYVNDEKEFIEKKVESYNLGRLATYQDYIFTAMLTPERIMDITRYFILFDANIKKVCRYQQYYGVKSMIATITQFEPSGRRKSGVIWHTQGSGKSLTMVMIANYILNNISVGKSRVVIVTDRKELDKQITKTFSNTKIKPSRATTGRNLVELIEEGKADIITTIINKFNAADKSKTKLYSPDIFVLIDESHRSNYGELATKMRLVFPNACYLGFTGTPLMKKEKTALKFGGNYIHKYTIKDGVDDKAIVPLVYEGRFVEQKVDEKNIDLWFERTCRKLTQLQQEELRIKWSSLKKLNSTNARIERIALDIDNHFSLNFQNTGFKAMLATSSKLDAVKYYNTFKSISNLEVAVCISSPDTREGTEEVDEDKVPEVVKFWKDMMDIYSNPDDYEDSIKNKFIDGDIDILIVCSKLLTGFDAPLCQVLYLDKELKEHGLLQAIARTNRLYDGKDYGLIVDYRGLLPRLNDAMNIYSGNTGLDNYDKNDLNGLMTDILSSVANLRQAYTNLENNFVKIKNKNDEEEYEQFLEKDSKLREKFYDDLCEFGKALSVVLSSETAYDAIYNNNQKEIYLYKDKFKFYSKLRVMIKKRCAETIDNKEYENEMRNLLNKHLSVVDLNILTKPLDIMNKGELEKELEEFTSKAAKADAIRHNISKNIHIKQDTNPAYYDAFSKRIKDTLDAYKQQVISDAEYLSAMSKILEDFRNNDSGIKYPNIIKGNVQAQAYYGVLLPILDQEGVKDIEIVGFVSSKIVEVVEEFMKVDAKTNKEVHKQIGQGIEDLLLGVGSQKGILEDVSFETIDKIIENILIVTFKRY